MRLTISTRLGGAILALLIMLLACGGAGYYAANDLSKGLDYVTTVAWDAADDGVLQHIVDIQFPGKKRFGGRCISGCHTFLTDL